jgi:single-strand DNA-binding protein
MAGSVNKAIIIGNLGRDPEVRSAQSGAKIVNLSVATSETWKDRVSGERREKTEWHRVVIFNDQIADLAEKYLRKGSKVYVEGQVQTRKWTAKDGVEKYTTEIVLQRYRGILNMLDTRGGGDSDNWAPDQIGNNGDNLGSLGPTGDSNDSASDNKPFNDDIPFDDDIPFG